MTDILYQCQGVSVEMTISFASIILETRIPISLFHFMPRLSQYKFQPQDLGSRIKDPILTWHGMVSLSKAGRHIVSHSTLP